MAGAIRGALYRRGIFSVYRAPVPVISIGNLAAGGTGKTPAVDFVVRHLLAAGKKVAVVSRGYGGTGTVGGVGVVCSGSGPLLPPAVCGDEPYLLARRNPRALVLVAPRRAAGIQLAVERFGAEVIVLDDGFQHLAVARDLDIVLLDGRRPLGNGRVLPAGVLREFPAALQRGHLFILTRCREDWPSWPSLPDPVLHSRHLLDRQAVSLAGEAVSLAELAGRRGVAFAGIADPEGFFTDLRHAGLHLVHTLALADHAGYGSAELTRLAAAAAGADYLITTEKDAVKLGDRQFPVPCYQVPVRLVFREEGKLEGLLRELLNRGGAHDHFPRTA